MRHHVAETSDEALSSSTLFGMRPSCIELARTSDARSSVAQTCHYTPGGSEAVEVASVAISTTSAGQGSAACVTRYGHPGVTSEMTVGPARCIIGPGPARARGSPVCRNAWLRRWSSVLTPEINIENSIRRHNCPRSPVAWGEYSSMTSPISRYDLGSRSVPSSMVKALASRMPSSRSIRRCFCTQSESRGRSSIKTVELIDQGLTEFEREVSS